MAGRGGRAWVGWSGRWCRRRPGPARVRATPRGQRGPHRSVPATSRRSTGTGWSGCSRSRCGSVRCRYCSSRALLARMSLFQAVRLLTPTMSTFHHSDWWLLAVATMWLCAGSVRLPVPLPSTEVRSMVLRVVDAVPGRALQGGLRRGEAERHDHVQRVERAGRGLRVVGPALALRRRRGGRRLLAGEVLRVVEPHRVPVVEALGEALVAAVGRRVMPGHPGHAGRRRRGRREGRPGRDGQARGQQAGQGQPDGAGARVS